MVFIKPPDVRYVDMCIWVDENAYKKDCDVNKLFEYLYFLALMLAHKAKYFTKNKDYEDFAVYMASRTYFRLTNHKQFEVDDSGDPKQNKIKSVLNYMKSILYPCKVDFQQQYYAQTVVTSDDTNYDSEYSFEDKLHESLDEISIKEFEVCLNSIVDSCRSFISQIPYKVETATWQNIYLSVMLTFLNSITMPNSCVDKPIEECAEIEDCVILFHLPDTFRDYIIVLVRKMRHKIASDLSYVFHTYIPSKGIDAVTLYALNGATKKGEISED